MRSAFIASIVAILTLVAGCSTDDGDEQPAAEVDAADAEAPDEDAEQPAGDEPELTAPADDSQLSEEERWADNHRRTEEHIAECMALQGFDFEPRPWDMGGPPDDLRAGLSDEEFLEQFGYGIATTQEELEEPDDPNQLYLARLSPAERDAFDLALHGEYFLNPETGFLEFGGCFAEAQEEVYGETNELWEELSTQIEDLEARFENDSRVIEARDAWGVCMAEYGYAFDDEGAAQAYVYDRLHELTEPNDDGLLQRDPEALEELRAEELRIAAADADCASEHLSQLDAWRTEIEADWATEHQDLLDDAMGTD